MKIGQIWHALVCPAVIIVLALCSFAQTSGNQGSKPVFRSTTRLVIIDVVATDEKGAPVTGLKAEDFVVTEDGHEQTIADFSFHQPSSLGQAVRQPAPNIVSNSPAYTGNSALNVILLDGINTDFTNHAYAQELLVKYLESSPKIQPTAVYALESNLRLLHDFTTDTKELRDAVAHYKGVGPTHIQTVEAAASPFTQHGTFRNVPQGRTAAFRSMIFLAQALSGYRGRKNLIWISEGFPLNLFSDVSEGGEAMIVEDYSPLMEKIADDLMAAQVAVYPISAAGVSKNDQFSAKTAMSGMAHRTGGKTFFNRNDLETGIRSSLDDGSTYYTLEYYPSNKNWDNKFRHIKVNVAKGSVKLQYRDGYYGDSPLTTYSLGTLGDEFSKAMDINAPALTAIGFQAAVLPASKETQNHTTVNVAIDPHSLSFERGGDGLEHAHVSCVVWAYPHKGDPIRSEGTYDAALKPEQYEQMMKSYFPCRRMLDLKPGSYTLRIGILDRTTNLIGTVSTPVVVP